METSISAILIPCLKSFNQLLEQAEQPDYDREVSSALWGDELGRLRVWAANIGAHQTGQSSLDFRLRDASHISNQITKLLRDLEQSLKDIFEELSKDGTKDLKEAETLGAWPGDDSTTDLQQLYEEVTNIIDCLYQLSMLIRKPAQHDLLVGSRMGDKAEFESYDKEHVRNLYPKTEEQISQRLGRAITRRRKYLFYRDRHHKKLEKGIEEIQGVQRTATESAMSETIATDFKAPNIEFDENSSNSGMSQTSYANSLVDGGRITIPAPPKDSIGGKPFECPYCFFLIDIKSIRSWNRHIFLDIKPYVCTFSDCSVPDRLYDSRHEWYFHETSEHYREVMTCPLCKMTLTSSKQYGKHVARHLEELALFALPRTEMDDANDDAHSVFGFDRLTIQKTAPYNADGNDDLFYRMPMEEDSIALDSESGESWVEAEEEKTGLDTSILAGSMNDSDRWMQIRKKAAERAARTSEEQDSRMSQDKTDDGEEETIESRVARIKARVAELTGDTQAEATTMNHAQYEDRSPSRSPRGQSNNRRGSQLHHYDDSENEHHEAAYSPHQRRQLSKTHGNRSPSPNYDYELEKKMKKLEELEEKEKEDIEEEVKKKAIEEYNIKLLEEKAKKEKANEEADEEFLEREKKRFVQAGHDEESIEKMLEKEEKGKEHGHNKQIKIGELTRPRYIKVHRKHMSPQTLDEYNLPWCWDERDSNYLVIKQWIPEDDQNTLFEHTKKMQWIPEDDQNTLFELTKKNSQKIKADRSPRPQGQF